MYIPLPFRLLWRFFTGSHLDGKQRRRPRGTVLPRYTNYFWNRYSRPKRALWRNAIFWATIGFTYGLLFDRKFTSFVGLALLPFAGLAIFRKTLDSLTQVVRFQNSDGVSENYRILRPQIRQKLATLKPAKIRVKLPDAGPVPPDLERAIQADNAEEHGEPIMNLRLMELMANGENDVTHTPITGRAKTIARKRKNVG